MSRDQSADNIENNELDHLKIILSCCHGKFLISQIKKRNTLLSARKLLRLLIFAHGYVNSFF